MKLCIIHINAEAVSAPYTERVIRHFDRVKRPETVLEHRYVRSRRATDAVLSFQYLLNKFDVAQHLIAADRAGYDGMMVACTGDPAVVEGRSLVSVPVVGPFEAAMHLACGYGQKVGVVTVADRPWLESVHGLIAGFGLKERVSGVSPIGIDSLTAFSRGFADPAPVAAEIEKQARALVTEGANAIVIASAGLGTIATAAGLTSLPDLGVPIFDTLPVGLKTLEMRVELTRAFGLPPTSRTGLTQQMAAADIDRLAKLYEFSQNLK